MKHFLTLLALLVAIPAQACLFARSAQPKDWLDWASVLLAADVSSIEQDKGTDSVQLSVRETFKGPPAAPTATCAWSKAWVRRLMVAPAKTGV